MSTTSPADTIVLVHGLWMTPLSWEHWIARFEAADDAVNWATSHSATYASA